MTKTYYSTKEVESIVDDIKKLGLDCAKSMDNAQISELQSQFNGAGSDSIPLVLRKALSKLLRLKCTVAIHDWDYYKSNATKEGQLIADQRFFKNGHIEIYARLSWWNPLRYWALYKLSVAYKLLKRFGESAYKSSYEKFNNAKTLLNLN